MVSFWKGVWSLKGSNLEISIKCGPGIFWRKKDTTRMHLSIFAISNACGRWRRNAKYCRNVNLFPEPIKTNANPWLSAFFPDTTSPPHFQIKPFSYRCCTEKISRLEITLHAFNSHHPTFFLEVSLTSSHFICAFVLYSQCHLSYETTAINIATWTCAAIITKNIMCSKWILFLSLRLQMLLLSHCDFEIKTERNVI